MHILAVYDARNDTFLQSNTKWSVKNGFFGNLVFEGNIAQSSNEETFSANNSYQMDTFWNENIITV